VGASSNAIMMPCSILLNWLSVKMSSLDAGAEIPSLLNILRMHLKQLSSLKLTLLIVISRYLITRYEASSLSGMEIDSISISSSSTPSPNQSLNRFNKSAFAAFAVG
jgi:hypothetical protein